MRLNLPSFEALDYDEHILKHQNEECIVTEEENAEVAAVPTPPVEQVSESADMTVLTNPITEIDALLRHIESSEKDIEADLKQVITLLDGLMTLPIDTDGDLFELVSRTALRVARVEYAVQCRGKIMESITADELLEQSLPWYKRALKKFKKVS